MILAKLFTKIFKEGGIILIDSENQKYIYDTYKDKENIQRRITEIVSTAITPLEWKTTEIKENSSANNADIKNTKVIEPEGEIDLPF